MANNFIDAYKNVANDISTKATNFINALRNAAAQSRGESNDKMVQKIPEMPKTENIEKIPEPEAPSMPVQEPGTVGYDKDRGLYYYTYKPGDTFGQVIKDIGLESGNGLWGDNGDVAYYTQQLHDQGIYGNIPIGTTIMLRHRNAPPIEEKAVEEKAVEEKESSTLEEFIRKLAKTIKSKE